MTLKYFTFPVYFNVTFPNPGGFNTFDVFIDVKYQGKNKLSEL